MINKTKYIHECDNFPNTQRIVTIEDGWATDISQPNNGSFPIYKKCCHFYKMKYDGTKQKEIDFSNIRPKLIIK